MSLLLPFALLTLVLGVNGQWIQRTNSLYANSEHILELTPQNFDSYVYGDKSRAYFVEFYLTWCGTCLQYKSTWEKFSRNVSDWDSVVKIAVLNCAPRNAWAFCQQHSIRKTPAIKYFPFNSRSQYDAQPFVGNIYDKYNMNYMTNYLASAVVSDRTTKPASLPRFQPIQSYENLASILPYGTQYVAVIFEYGNNEIAKQVTLDFSKHAQIAVFGAAPNHPLATGVRTTFPALLIYQSAALHAPQFVSQEAITRPFAKKTIREIARLGSSAAVVSSKRRFSDSTLVKTVENPMRKHRVNMQDLESTVIYLLQHEVAMSQRIEGQHLQSLVHFLRLLARYFPGSGTNMVFLHRLYSWTRGRTEISGTDFHDAVEFLQKDFDYPFPKEISWVSCKGSEPFLRGYSCGIWLLFHTLTVNAYVQDGHKEAFDPLQVLEGIHGYIRDFFSCDECSTHFEKGAKKMPDQVKIPEDVILWLWRSHNISSYYLAGTVTEDPEFPKSQFPDKKLCPSCHTPEGEWNEAEVVKFLTEMYTSIDF